MSELIHKGPSQPPNQFFEIIVNIVEVWSLQIIPFPIGYKINHLTRSDETSRAALLPWEIRVKL